MEWKYPIEPVKNLRSCKYEDETYKFHAWIQEGELRGTGCGSDMLQRGKLTAGAILEKSDGSIIKVFNITKICFID